MESLGCCNYFWPALRTCYKYNNIYIYRISQNMDLDVTVNANRSAENFQIPCNLHACFLSLQTHSQFTFRQEPLSVDDFSGHSLFVFSDGNNTKPFAMEPLNSKKRHLNSSIIRRSSWCEYAAVPVYGRNRSFSPWFWLWCVLLELPYILVLATRNWF